MLSCNKIPGIVLHTILILMISAILIITFSTHAFAILYDGTEAAVSIILHHAETNQLDAINTEMNDMPSIIAIVVERVGNSGYMTQQELLNLQNLGHEISSHSESHDVIDSNTSSEKLYYETVQSKIDLENMGLDVYGFNPPRNIVTNESFVLIQQNYEWTEFFSPITYRPKYVSPEVLEYSKKTYGLYHLPAWGVGNGDTLNNFQDVKAQIDYAIANKYWIAFNFHHIVDGSGTYDISPAIFHDIIEYIRTQRGAGNLNVITMAEGVGLSNPSLIPPTTTASPSGGTYSSAQLVKLTASEPSTIYYTTNGSTPTTSSSTYSNPIPISSNTTLKFFAVDTAGNQESVKTATYTITSFVPTTHMSDTTASTGQSIYSGRQIHAEYVSPASQLIGDNIDSITLKLKKNGTPTGIAEIGVFNTDLSVKKLIATKDVSTLTTSYTDYTFSLPSGQTYQIQSGDRIGIKYTGGTSTVNISVMRDTVSSDPFDGTNSYHVYYTTSWTSFTQNDLYMILRQSSPSIP